MKLGMALCGKLIGPTEAGRWASILVANVASGCFSSAEVFNVYSSAKQAAQNV
jgi:hypothetical protein